MFNPGVNVVGVSNTAHLGRGRHASARLSLRGQRVVVHAFACGTVTIKRCHHTGCLPESAPYALRFAAILADRRFADPMPIWCYVIEHPAGLVVVDAGADPTYADGASWAGHQGGRRFMQSFLRLQVSEEEVLPVQMREVGLHSAAVDAVVLTHQHIDHTGTVPAFTTAELWTTRAEDAAARILGAEQWRWRPTGRRVRHVDVEGASGELGQAVDLFGDASLRLIHTPGHTPGSITVVLATDQTTLWFTGDTSFTAEAMDPAARTAGIHTDMRAVRRLQARLKGGGALFPSHDPEASTRLTSLSGARTDEPA